MDQTGVNSAFQVRQITLVSGPRTQSFAPPTTRGRSRGKGAVVEGTQECRGGRRLCENSASDSVYPCRATVVAIFSHAARPLASKIRTRQTHSEFSHTLGGDWTYCADFLM
jgi:hypothetical protein